PGIPAGALSGNRFAHILTGQLACQSGSSQIALWQSASKFLRRQNLGITRDFLCDFRTVKELGKEFISMLPVVELIVVRSRINIFVPAKGIFGVVKFEERTNLLVDIRLYQGREKAAVILFVVNEQRGPRSPHGDKKRVVELVQQVGSRLFHFLSIRGPRQV